MTGTIDLLGDRTKYLYDADNRRTAVTDALNHTTTTVYDAGGNVVNTIDPLGHTITYAYDALNRQTLVTQPVVGTATTVYDGANNVLAQVDPLGRRTSFAYDSDNWYSSSKTVPPRIGMLVQNGPTSSDFL